MRMLTCIELENVPKVLRIGLALLVAVPCLAHADGSSGALTPPMGWNSWNHFAGRVTDADIRAAADALVRTGMRDAGYIYVNVDDTWKNSQAPGTGTIPTCWRSAMEG